MLKSFVWPQDRVYFDQFFFLLSTGGDVIASLTCGLTLPDRFGKLGYHGTSIVVGYCSGRKMANFCPFKPLCHLSAAHSFGQALVRIFGYLNALQSTIRLKNKEQHENLVVQKNI